MLTNAQFGFYVHRDSSELQKPAALNAAVLTFYKYVKAARDGQDQKNCLALNPKCSM